MFSSLSAPSPSREPTAENSIQDDPVFGDQSTDLKGARHFLPGAGFTRKGQGRCRKTWWTASAGGRWTGSQNSEWMSHPVILHRGTGRWWKSARPGFLRALRHGLVCHKGRRDSEGIQHQAGDGTVTPPARSAVRMLGRFRLAMGDAVPGYQGISQTPEVRVSAAENADGVLPAGFRYPSKSASSDLTQNDLGHGRAKNRVKASWADMCLLLRDGMDAVEPHAPGQARRAAASLRAADTTCSAVIPKCS